MTIVRDFSKPLPDLPVDKLQVNPDEYMSEDFLMILFSLMESKGFTGFNQLQAVVDDPKVILKILRLMHGMQFKIPTLIEFANLMQLAVFIYATLIRDKNLIDISNHKTVDSLYKYLGFTLEEKTKYDMEATEWRKYLEASGYKLSDFIPKLATKKNKKQKAYLLKDYQKPKK